MPADPWRVNFPVLVDPASREEHIVFLCKWIADARPWMPPTRGWVIGMTKTGVLRKFTIYKEDWDRAARSPIHFLQVDNIQAPAGALVNPSGEALSSGDAELK